MKRNDNDVQRKKMSIRWKLFIYFIMFTGIILVLLWSMQVVFLEPIYKFIKINEIKVTAKSLSNNIDRADIFDYAYNLGEQNEICILAYKLIKTPVVIGTYEYLSIDTLPDCAIHKITMSGVRTLYTSAVTNNGELLQYFQYDAVNSRYESIDDYNIFRTHSDNSESIIYTQLLNNAAGEEILLMVNSVISPVGATIKTLNVQLTVISGVLIILAVILTWIFAKRISGPIVVINDSAKILATGNYNVEFDRNGYKEIAELAETLNYAADELSKIDKLKSDLIANISHDLRTPLTMIVGYSEIMRDIPGENTPENVQIIIDEANRLTSLVNDVLDISKLQSGSQTFENTQFNLTLSLKNALRRYNKLTEQDGYIIDFMYNNEEIVINSDETRIMQAFYNLVNNAVTYTGADKRVTVIQTINNGFVRIAVKDTGEGIESDKLPYIWERYYKINKVHKRASIGTGLGLSIVKSIIDTAGGHYGVESIIGIGSTFWFELPLMK